MIHTRTSTLQFRKVQGSKLFARLSVSRQGSKALRLQEAKFGLPPFHTSNPPTFLVPRFHGPRDPHRESPKIQSFRWGLRVPSAGSRLARKFQGSGDPALQDSKVAGFQGSKVTRLQESKVAGFHGFKAPRFQSSGITGFQNGNPLLETSQEFLAGSFPVTFPDASTKLADLVWILFY